jgi:hypothetical protein
MFCFTSVAIPNKVAIVSVRDQCIYITRVAPHINAVQRDYRSLVAHPPEQDSRFDVNSPSNPFVPLHFPVVSPFVSTWPQNFFFCIFLP